MVGDSYFAAVVERANKIYEEIFRSTNHVLVVTAQTKCFDWSPEAAQFRHKHRGKKLPDLFRYSRKAQLGLGRPAGKQSFVDLEDMTSREIVTLRWTEAEPLKTGYQHFFEAIANQDFPSRHPQCVGEVFLVDPNRHIILNMYDDRGMDVIAHSSDALQKLYTTHNEWILDYDREKTEQLFSAGGLP